MNLCHIDTISDVSNRACVARTLTRDLPFSKGHRSSIVYALDSMLRSGVALVLMAGVRGLPLGTLLS